MTTISRRMKLVSIATEPVPLVPGYFETGTFPEFGSDNANGDFSSEPGHFCLFPDPKRRFVIKNMIISIQDSGTVKSDRYGSEMLLTNGVQCRVVNPNGIKEDLLDGITVMTNQDWERVTGQLRVPPFTPTNGVTVVWEFAANVVLNFREREFMAITLNDDFTALSGHHFLCEGQDLPL